MDFILRLKHGEDLKKGIWNYCINNNITSGFVCGCVGCVYKANIRMAKAEVFKEYNDDFEIVSLSGSISKDGLHIHISLSDEKGNVIGGHLLEGCLVNTTAEIYIRDFSDRYVLSREYDPETGYKELVIQEVK